MSNQAAEKDAHLDAQRMNAGQSVGDKTQVLLEEVNNAHQEYASNPEGYKAWFQTVRGDLKNDTSNGSQLLQTLELYDSTSGPTDQRLVQALDRNGQELENALDTYATNKGASNEGSDGEFADSDIQAFLDDVGVEGSVANRLAGQSPEDLKNLLTSLRDKEGEAHTKTSLLDGLGYRDSDDDPNTADIDGFRNDHPMPGPGEDYNPDQPQNAVVFSENGKPQTIVQADGTSTALHYDSNNNIDGINVSRFENGAQANHQLKRTADGSWVDENGNKAPIQAPFIDGQGNFGFYTPQEGNPNLYKKTTVDTYSGKSSVEDVDLNGTDQAGAPIAIAGLNRPLNVDGSNQGNFKVGNLDVHSAALQEGQAVGDAGLNSQAQASYTIKDGDNLTNIVRNALNLPAGYDGPELQAAMKQLADANKYQDLDTINAGTELIIPPDWNTRPVVVPPPAAVPAA